MTTPAPPVAAPDVPKSLRTPYVIRAWRTLRVVLHLLRGLLTIFFVFPMCTLRDRRRRIKAWSRRLLRLLNVRSVTRGLSPAHLPGNALIVCNHVSWLDIFVILSLRVSRFVGKAELGEWPLVRHLILGTGTILIDRSKRRDTARINRTISELLCAGDCVAIFPEGTTTDGRHVLHFHASLLQPAIDAGGHIAPIALRYRNALGERSESTLYTGDTTFAQSFWWVVRERALTVEINLLPLLAAEGQSHHRRELALAAQQAIAGALDVPTGPAYGRRVAQGTPG